MGLDAQLKRTTGTVYGEIMRDSGITLPNGRYIGVDGLISGLMACGVRASEPVMLRNIGKITNYGPRDNTWTRVQSFQRGSVSNRRADGESNFFYNPWKELMKGSFFGSPHEYYFFPHGKEAFGKKAFETLKHNPKKGVERIADLYKLFANLPKGLQYDILRQIDTDSCNMLINVAAQCFGIRGFYSPQSKIISAVMEYTPKKRQEDMLLVLELLGVHNICVRKGEIVRREIEELVMYDSTGIPTRWRQGHLHKAAITAERIEELNRLLLRRRETR